MSAELIDRFYTSLSNRDGDAMAGCYSHDIVFEDPAFGVLSGRDPGDMWRMLCSSGTDLSVEHSIESATDDAATAHWVAKYTFTATGRPVVNNITARMQIREGLIVDHRDSFDFWKWASQALGATGKLLGWSPMLQSKVQKTTRQSLDKFQARNIRGPDIRE